MYGYFCSLCQKTHQMNSNIGKEHYSSYLLEQDKLDKAAEYNRELAKVTKERKGMQTSEEKLFDNIFGKYDK